MDQADTGEEASPLFHAVSHHGALLGHHDNSIGALIDANQSLSYQVTHLTSQVTALLSIQTSGSNQPRGEATSPESHCTDPEPFCGEPKCCCGFLFQCSVVFQQRPKQFNTDSARIHYMCGLMRGKALQWAEAKFSRNHLVFDHPDYDLNSSLRLMKLSQGERAVSDYTIEFWTLAADGMVSAPVDTYPAPQLRSRPTSLVGLCARVRVCLFCCVSVCTHALPRVSVGKLIN
uniref:Retrotransposon gag domain-containing protein n=1 Tax=Oryzias melastigma TaxID=30732 RepID=A0A3B3C8P3_ORYME